MTARGEARRQALPGSSVKQARMEASHLGDGRYRVIGILGHGGMGTVYHCLDLAHDRSVAVKELVPPSGRAAADRIAQFQDEATLLAALWHPHLPRVFAVFEEDGRHYIVMERVNGHTMRDWVEQHGLPPRATAIRWLDRLLDVIGFLHAQTPPVIFRDVSPDNVMVSDTELKLIDFGLARRLLPETRTRPALSGWGSPGFAAPEHYASRGTGAAADLYGVAAIGFWLLSGEAPPEAVGRLVNGDDGLTTLAPHVSPALLTWVRTGMALDPAARFSSAEPMRQALLQAADDPTDAEAAGACEPEAAPLVAPEAFLEAMRARLTDQAWDLRRDPHEPFALEAERRVQLRISHGLCWSADALDEDAIRNAATLARQHTPRLAGLLPSAGFFTIAAPRVDDPAAVAAAAAALSEGGLRACLVLPVDLQRGVALDAHIPEEWRNSNDPGDFVLTVRIAAGGGVAPL